MPREIGLKTVRAVAGILIRNGRLLVAERPVGKPYSGYWEFPGGKIEPQESAEQALVRELHEELGINVVACAHLFDHVYTYPDKRVELEVWQINQFTSEPVGRENQLLQWVSVEEIKQLRLLEGNWPILDKIINLSL